MTCLHFGWEWLHSVLLEGSGFNLEWERRKISIFLPAMSKRMGATQWSLVSLQHLTEGTSLHSSKQGASPLGRAVRSRGKPGPRSPSPRAGWPISGGIPTCARRKPGGGGPGGAGPGAPAPGPSSACACGWGRERLQYPKAAAVRPCVGSAGREVLAVFIAGHREERGQCPEGAVRSMDKLNKLAVPAGEKFR